MSWSFIKQRRQNNRRFQLLKHEGFALFSCVINSVWASWSPCVIILIPEFDFFFVQFLTQNRNSEWAELFWVPLDSHRQFSHRQRDVTQSLSASTAWSSIKLSWLNHQHKRLIFLLEMILWFRKSLYTKTQRDLKLTTSPRVHLDKKHPINDMFAAINLFRGIKWYETWWLSDCVHLLIQDLTQIFVSFKFHVCQDVIFLK